MTLADLRALIRHFHEERDWNRYHNAKDLSLSISLEANELLELFQWRNEAEVAYMEKDPAWRAAVADELADVLIYACTLGDRLDLDISQAILTKMARNQQRFPVGVAPTRVEDGPPAHNGMSRDTNSA